LSFCDKKNSKKFKKKSGEKLEIILIRKIERENFEKKIRENNFCIQNQEKIQVKNFCKHFIKN